MLLCLSLLKAASCQIPVKLNCCLAHPALHQQLVHLYLRSSPKYTLAVFSTTRLVTACFRSPAVEASAAVLQRQRLGVIAACTSLRELKKAVKNLSQPGDRSGIGQLSFAELSVVLQTCARVWQANSPKYPTKRASGAELKDDVDIGRSEVPVSSSVASEQALIVQNVSSNEAVGRRGQTVERFQRRQQRVVAAADAADGPKLPIDRNAELDFSPALLCASLHHKLSESSLKDMARVFWALGILQDRQCDNWVPQIAERVLQAHPAEYKKLDAAALEAILWGMAHLPLPYAPHQLNILAAAAGARAHALDLRSIVRLASSLALLECNAPRVYAVAIKAAETKLMEMRLHDLATLLWSVNYVQHPATEFSIMAANKLFGRLPAMIRLQDGNTVLCRSMWAIALGPPSMRNTVTKMFGALLDGTRWCDLADDQLADALAAAQAGHLPPVEARLDLALLALAERAHSMDLGALALAMLSMARRQAQTRWRSGFPYINEYDKAAQREAWRKLTQQVEERLPELRPAELLDILEALALSGMDSVLPLRMRLAPLLVERLPQLSDSALLRLLVHTDDVPGQQAPHTAILGELDKRCAARQPANLMLQVHSLPSCIWAAPPLAAHSPPLLGALMECAVSLLPALPPWCLGDVLRPLAKAAPAHPLMHHFWSALSGAAPYLLPNQYAAIAWTLHSTNQQMPLELTNALVADFVAKPAAYSPSDVVRVAVTMSHQRELQTPQFADAIEVAMEEVLPLLTFRDCCRGMVALSVSPRPSSQVLLTKVRHHALKQAEKSGLQNLVAGLQELLKGRRALLVQSPQLVLAALDATRRKSAGRINATAGHSLSFLTWLCWTFSIHDLTFLQFAADKLAEAAPQLECRSLSQALLSLLCCPGQYPHFVSAALQSLQAQAEKLDPISLHYLLEALTRRVRSENHDTHIQMALTTSILFATESRLFWCRCTPAQLALLAQSMVALKLLDANRAEHIRTLAVEQLPAFTPPDFLNLVWALQRSGVHDDKLAAAAVEAVRAASDTHHEEDADVHKMA